jgi:hypothetical protein
MNSTHDHVALAVRAEHRELHQRMRELQQHLTENQPATSDWQQVADGLAALRGQLARHFEREETGGFLDEAVGLVPRLGNQVARLMRDHAEFLTELDGILLLAGSKTRSAADRADLRERALGLFHALRLHEAAEEHVLQQVFPSDAEETE